MHKAYHGLMTDAVKLEERNVYCSSYNVCVLIDWYVCVTQHVFLHPNRFLPHFPPPLPQLRLKIAFL